MRPTLSEDSVRLIEGRPLPKAATSRPKTLPAPPNLAEAFAKAAKNQKRHRAKK